MKVYKSVTMGLFLQRTTRNQTKMSATWLRSDEGLELCQANSVIIASFLEPDLHAILFRYF